jgi:hypothetical protein
VITVVGLLVTTVALGVTTVAGPAVLTTLVGLLALTITVGLLVIKVGLLQVGPPVMNGVEITLLKAAIPMGLAILTKSLQHPGLHLMTVGSLQA